MSETEKFNLDAKRRELREAMPNDRCHSEYPDDKFCHAHPDCRDCWVSWLAKLGLQFVDETAELPSLTEKEMRRCAIGYVDYPKDAEGNEQWDKPDFQPGTVTYEMREVTKAQRDKLAGWRKTVPVE